MSKNTITVLGDVASIELSNIDKHTIAGEKIVKVCNYTDVYRNDYISNRDVDDFLTASARDTSIKKFSLYEGQVALTKDSEKSDDIGISTYITETLKNVVLGYHLALITPKKNELDGKFLNYYFRSSYAKKYFENNASGSGQRYTLTKDVLRDIKLHLPVYQIQKVIGNLLYNFDQKISTNNSMNTELEKLTKTIFDYWFVQFDFPDKNGKPYKSSGGEMVYNETLKREIPKYWTVKKLSDIVKYDTGAQPPKSEHIETYKNGYVRFIQNRDYENESHLTYIKISSTNSLCDVYDIMIDKYGDRTAGKTRFGIKGAYNVALMKITPMISETQEYLRGYLGIENIFNFLHNACLASTRASLNSDTFQSLYVVMPDKELLKCYEAKAKIFIDTILQNKKQNIELANLRDFLLSLLMNGQVTIQSENKNEPKTITDYENFKENIGLAARGDIDEQTIQNIYKAHCEKVKENDRQGKN